MLCQTLTGNLPIDAPGRMLGGFIYISFTLHNSYGTKPTYTYLTKKLRVHELKQHDQGDATSKSRGVFLNNFPLLFFSKSNRAC